MSSFFAGAEMITFFTGPRRCFLASLASVKRPVDSITTCAPTDSQGRAAGSFSLNTLMTFPSTVMLSAPALILFGRLPRIGIVLQQMRQRLRIGKIVDRHEFQIRVIERGAQNVAADASEAVDANFDCHGFSVLMNAITESSWPLYDR